MRTISSAVQSQLSLSSIRSFFLIELSGILRYHTTLPQDITMSDGKTYLSDGGLVGIDPPRLSSVVDREAYKVTFSDSEFEFRDYFTSGAVGDQLIVRLGFFNNSDAPVIGSDTVSVEPDQIFRSISDTIIVYQGVIDNQNYDVDFDNNSVVATIEGSSPLAHLDRINEFVTSKDNMLQYSSTDTSMEKAYQGSGEIKLKWGKA